MPWRRPPTTSPLYALSLDDPEAEGLTGPDGDHLPVTRGARRWRMAYVAGQDEDRAAAQYHAPASPSPRPGTAGTRSPTGRGPATRAGTTSPTWHREPHEAVGPGAHAFDGVTRRWNAARLDGYLAALEAGAAPPGGSAATEPDAAAAEAVILALRLDTGIPLSAAHEPPLADQFGWALAAELLDVTEDGRVVLTTRGRLASNELSSASSERRPASALR